MKRFYNKRLKLRLTDLKKIQKLEEIPIRPFLSEGSTTRRMSRHSKEASRYLDQSGGSRLSKTLKQRSLEDMDLLSFKNPDRLTLHTTEVTAARLMESTSWSTRNSPGSTSTGCLGDSEEAKEEKKGRTEMKNSMLRLLKKSLEPKLKH